MFLIYYSKACSDVCNTLETVIKTEPLNILDLITRSNNESSDLCMSSLVTSGINCVAFAQRNLGDLCDRAPSTSLPSRSRGDLRRCIRRLKVVFSKSFWDLLFSYKARGSHSLALCNSQVTFHTFFINNCLTFTQAQNERVGGRILSGQERGRSGAESHPVWLSCQ